MLPEARPMLPAAVHFGSEAMTPAAVAAAAAVVAARVIPVEEGDSLLNVRVSLSRRHFCIGGFASLC